MENVLLDKNNLVNFIISLHKREKKREISPIKLQKSLYFLYAFWGGKIRAAKGESDTDTEADEIYGSFNEYLFDANFVAWKYGPVDKEVRDNYKHGIYTGDSKELMFLGDVDEFQKETATDYITALLARIFATSDFGLVDLSHEDKCWKEAKIRFDQQMDKESIIEEYANR